MFQQGFSGNPKGKPKGSENKVTKEIREKIGLIIDNNFDKIQSDLSSLQPKDRLFILLQLIKFVTPQLKAIEIDNNQENDQRFKPIIIEYYEKQ